MDVSKPMKDGSLPPKKRAAVHVLGCKVNQAEAAAMARMLERRGYLVDNESGSPDLIVVNTCCVTSRAEAKSRRLAQRLAKRFPAAELVITGCLAEINPDSLHGISRDQVLLGTFEKDHFAEFLDRPSEASHQPGLQGAVASKAFGELGSAGMPDRGRAFLKIQDGCSQHCSYCIVPRARGPSRSLPMDRVLRQAEHLQAEGFAEIVLSGIHLGAYGKDLVGNLSLEKLLETLVETCRDVRFRLSSVEPQEITPYLVELVAEHPRICRHFHIPLQSGDDKILNRMERPYDTTFVRKLVCLILERAPDTCIGMDVMPGFPGEDEESFVRTRRLIEELRPAYLHVFPFSPRAGTRAASFTPNVHHGTARSRVENLRGLSTKLRIAFYERFLGRTLRAVPESQPDPVTGEVRARTDNYIPVRVVVGQARKGMRQFSVRLDKLEGLELHGTMASPAGEKKKFE